MTIARDDAFGLVLTVLNFHSDAEAIEIANVTLYGLFAGVFISDLDRVTWDARGIRAGQLLSTHGTPVASKPLSAATVNPAMVVKKAARRCGIMFRPRTSQSSRAGFNAMLNGTQNAWLQQSPLGLDFGNWCFGFDAPWKLLAGA